MEESETSRSGNLIARVYWLFVFIGRDPILAFRLLLLFILTYLVILLINACFSSSRKKHMGRPQEHDDKGEEMVLDPQCQNYLAKYEAIFPHGYYFCSEECARIFVRRIERGYSEKS